MHCAKTVLRWVDALSRQPTNVQDVKVAPLVVASVRSQSTNRQSVNVRAPRSSPYQSSSEKTSPSTGSAVNAQPRYFSTTSVGRAAASSGFSPYSRRASRWRSRSQHWSSSASTSRSRACSSSAVISRRPSLARSSRSSWTRSVMRARMLVSSVPFRQTSPAARARVASDQADLKEMTMPDLAPVYERLESLLRKHTSGLQVSHDFADANAATTRPQASAPPEAGARSRDGPARRRQRALPERRVLRCGQARPPLRVVLPDGPLSRPEPDRRT